MQHKQSMPAIILSAAAIFVLILDAKTALAGAYAGVVLCLRTVIPSLFPFFFFCDILNRHFVGYNIKLFNMAGRLCGVPAGAEPLLLIGFTGGYPVGAKCIRQWYKCGALSKADAERMIGFCSNAGPSFLFGMTGALFPSPAAPWMLWLIQIICALIAGIILPGKNTKTLCQKAHEAHSNTDPLSNALQALAVVCGWVILFRSLIQILDRWVLWLFPRELTIVLTGILELSNGCAALQEMDILPVRFIAAAFISVFGGVCVCLQTASVCKEFSSKMYLTGKLIQAAISVPVSMAVSAFLFPDCRNLALYGVVIGICMSVGYIIVKKIKNNTGIPVPYHV